MTRLVVINLMLIVLMAIASCGGGSGNPTPEPNPLPAGSIQAVGYGSGLVRIFARPDSVDAGTAVVVSGGATGTGIAANDGSIEMDAAATGTGGTVGVTYTTGGMQSTTSATIVNLDSRITRQIAATGAAPNDIAANDSLVFVANSADNTISAYSYEGDPAGTCTLDTGSSPSYLSIDGGRLWVSCNGTNVISGLNAATVAAGPVESHTLNAASLAFLGPGRAAVTNDLLLIPCSGIAAFGDTTEYTEGRVIAIAKDSGEQEQISVNGVNVTNAVYDAQRAQIYVLATGSIQFDEYWMPYADSDSMLTILSYPGLNTITSINLGLAGASGLVIDNTNGQLLIGSMLSAELFVIELADFSIHRGMNNPVSLTSEFSFVSDLALDTEHGWLFCSSFNTDEVHVVGLPEIAHNPGPYPAPLNLELNAELMAGASSLVLSPDGEQLFVLHGIANSISRIELF